MILAPLPIIGQNLFLRAPLTLQSVSSSDPDSQQPAAYTEHGPHSDHTQPGSHQTALRTRRGRDVDHTLYCVGGRQWRRGRIHSLQNIQPGVENCLLGKF